MAAKNIKATKDGREKLFNQVQWDLMPANKYGWAQVSNSMVTKNSYPLKEGPEKVSINPPAEAIKPAASAEGSTDGTGDKPAKTPAAKGPKKTAKK